MGITTEIFNEHIKKAVSDTFDTVTTEFGLKPNQNMKMSEAKKTIVLEIADNGIHHTEAIHDSYDQYFANTPTMLFHIHMNKGAFDEPVPKAVWKLSVFMDRLDKVYDRALAEQVQYLDVERFVTLELKLALAKFRWMCDRYNVQIDSKNYAIADDERDIFNAENNRSHVSQQYSTKLTMNAIRSKFFSQGELDQIIKFRERLGW